MEYIYAAMLLHKAGKPVDEASVKKVLEAAGVKADDSRIKALVASLQGVNIDEVIQQAAVATVAPAEEKKAEAKEEKKEEAKEEKKDEMNAAAGLGSLFG